VTRNTGRGAARAWVIAEQWPIHATQQNWRAIRVAKGNPKQAV